MKFKGLGGEEFPLVSENHRSKHTRLAGFALAGGLAIALIGACWAAFANHACTSCEDAEVLLGGRSPAALGILLYGALCLLTIMGHMRKLVVWTLVCASGAHGALVFLLIVAGLTCPPCLLTAAGAWVACGAALTQVRPDRFRVFQLFGGVFCLVLLGSIAAQVLHARGLQAHADKLLQTVISEGAAPPADRMLMLVYVRDGCRYCARFEDEVVPELEKQYGERILVERRSAPEGYPTPTILLLSGDSRTAWGGFAPLDVVCRWIESAFVSRSG